MDIDETLTQIKAQNLCITNWIIIEEEQLSNINLGFEKTCNRLRLTLI
jgi:hypothetical protein